MIDDKQYRDELDFPMTNLAIAMFRMSASEMTDAQLVEHAAKKINMLIELLIVKGYTQEEINVILRN